MRSVLVTLGPYDWSALPVIAAVLVVFVYLWRRMERGLGEEPARISASWFAVVVPLIAAGTIAIWLGINRLAPLEIRSYGVMLLLGFTAGMVYLSRVGPPRGLSVPMAVDMALMILVLSIIGARLVFVLLLFDEYAKHPGMVLDVWRGGLSFHGGVLGGLAAVVLFGRWRRVRFDVLADLATPAVALGYAFTRIGCFLNGCCHGHATNLPWGIVFPENAARFPMPVHPTQLYAAAGSLVIFVVLVKLWPRLHRPGQLFPAYLMLYSVLRLGCEQTRREATAELLPFFPVLTIGQFACILIALVGLTWFVVLQRRPREDPGTASVLVDAPSVEADDAPVP